MQTVHTNYFPSSLSDEKTKRHAIFNLILCGLGGLVLPILALVLLYVSSSIMNDTWVIISSFLSVHYLMESSIWLKSLIDKTKTSERSSNTVNEGGSAEQPQASKDTAKKEKKDEEPKFFEITYNKDGTRAKTTESDGTTIKFVCWNKLSKEEENMTKCETEPDICDFAWALCTKTENLQRTVEENKRYVPEWLLDDSQTLQQIYLTAYLNIFLKMFVTYNYIWVLNENDAEITDVTWQVTVVRVVTCILLHSNNLMKQAKSLRFLKLTVLNIEDFDRPLHAVLFIICKLLSDWLLEFAQIWKILTLTSYIDILLAAAAFKFLYEALSVMIKPLLDRNM